MPWKKLEPAERNGTRPASNAVRIILNYFFRVFAFPAINSMSPTPAHTHRQSHDQTITSFLDAKCGAIGHVPNQHVLHNNLAFGRLISTLFFVSFPFSVFSRTETCSTRLNPSTACKSQDDNVYCRRCYKEGIYVTRVYTY